MRRTLHIATLLGAAIDAQSATVVVPVYGVPATADLDPAAAAWYATRVDDPCRALVVGTVTVEVPDAATAAALGAAAVLHARVVPILAGGPAGGWQVVGESVRRLEAISAQAGSLQTTVLLDLPAGAPALACMPSTLALEAYLIQGQTVLSLALNDGFAFPADDQAAAFRWSASGLRQRGSQDGLWLSGGGARLAALAAATPSALASYLGAWVQLHDPAAGTWRYVRQSSITPDDPTVADPVLMDGQLILGGSASATGLPGVDHAAYALESIPEGGTYALTDTVLASSLPQPLGAQAAAAEGPAPAPAGAPLVDTSVSRGLVPTISDPVRDDGEHAQLYADAAGDQTSTHLMDDVKTQRANSASSTPVDTMAGAGSGASASPDRITTPAVGLGASGLNQLQAQAQAAAWPMGTSITPDDSATTLVADPAAPQQGAASTLSGTALAQNQDQSLDDQVATVVVPGSGTTPPQRTPVVVNATGTVAQALAAGATAEVYGATDSLNQAMAPHMEATTWPGGGPAVRHHSVIHPVDYLDAALMARYAAATGVGMPDRAGNPVPGDGANPVDPVPQGCQAGHPFYDLDGDGSLDRWGSDDPFHGGYQKITVSWVQEAGGARELGAFTAHPAYSVCVTGTKAPTLTDSGTWATSRDLLFTIGHDFKPFDHETLTLTGYKTYYDGGLITPLDPIDASDPTLYQLALINTASFASTAPPPPDGANPADMAPTVASASATVSADLLGTGQPQSYVLSTTASFYDHLASQIASPPWQWSWSQLGYALPPAIPDHPGSPAVVVERWMNPSGACVRSATISRPLFCDPSTGLLEPFDPSLIPVQGEPSAPLQAVADTYMWNYPQVRSTAEGGTVPPNVAAWQYPWNLAWRDNPHSRNQSAQAFALDSGDLSAFPDLAGMMPVITHASLSAAAASLASASGLAGSPASPPAPPQVRWLLRESAQAAPSTGESFTDWLQGAALYGAPGWMPPGPWMSDGRAPFHLAWNGLSDDWAASRAPGACLQPTGTRIFDVEAGFSTYVFRGQTYTPATPEQQIALLNRMWNYDLTGYEFPPEGATTLPSLCIPQRFDNADPASPPLSGAALALGAAPEVTTDRADAAHAGDLGGTLVAELAQPSAPRLRGLTLRRARLMEHQVFLFSAARGREWELAMARRMPASVRLLCVEYDDRAAVKAILGGEGADVWFPRVVSTVVTDAQGGAHALDTSDETGILAELCRDWFDSQGPVVTFSQGRMALGGDGALHSPTPTNTQGLSTGSGTTIDPAQAGAAGGFACMLPDGIPAGVADFAFTLRSAPQFAQQQWMPDPGQAMASAVTVEFRHPMLLLYHDAASAIYIHYGRNADPDIVFGHWDACAPPAPAPVLSAEAERRARFDAWARPSQLGAIWDALNPDTHAEIASLQLALPPGPPDPGTAPAAPTPLPWPGQEPVAPTLTLPDWVPLGAARTNTAVAAPPTPEALDGYDDSAMPWADAAGYEGLMPQAQLDQYLSGQVEFDASQWGWLRVRYGADGPAGAPLGPPELWLAGGGTDLYPIGGSNQSCASALYGAVPSPVHAVMTYSDNSISFADLSSGSVVASAVWTDPGPLILPAAGYQALAANDAFGDGSMWCYCLAPDGRTLVSVPYDAIAHPMTPGYYAGWSQAQLVAWDEAIAEDRANAIALFTAAWGAFQSSDAQWQQSLAAWTRAQAVQAAYPAAAAAWQAAEAAWQAWQTSNAALIAARVAGAQAAADRQAWIAGVLGATAQGAVSWSGDPLCTCATLAAIEALPAQPIWQAYAWFIDPANAVPAATAASPAAPTPIAAP